jgi:hypothetical protein
MATADFATSWTIHEKQSLPVQFNHREVDNGTWAAGILAFIATLPRGHRRAKFTMPPLQSREG